MMPRQPTAEASSGLSAAQLAQAMQRMTPEAARPLVMASMQFDGISRQQLQHGSVLTQRNCSTSPTVSEEVTADKRLLC